MPAVQLVLTGVPAFVGNVVSATRVKFFIEENEFDPAKMIEVDLAKNTATIPPARWATDVDCDHQTDGGLTTLGPRFHGGKANGAVYLSERVVAQHAQLLASWPPPPDAIFQYQAVLRSDNGNTTRYHGFKVRVLSPAVGSKAHVAFVRVSAADPTGGRAAARWLDLNDPDVCDPASNGFTTIVPMSPVGSEHALFLRSEVIAADAPGTPKIPRGLGW